MPLKFSIKQNNMTDDSEDNDNKARQQDIENRD